MKYAAFLRAILPQINPSQKTENLVRIFKELGFENVESYFASGNIMFDSPETDRLKVETKIEEALKEGTGIETPTIIRSIAELQELTNRNPFKGVVDGNTSKPHVTFLKDTSSEWEVCFVVDITKTTTPKIMRDLEKKYGKKVTTRTWGTVQKVLKKMNG